MKNRQAASNKPQVTGVMLRVPEEAGIGVDWNDDYLREHLAPGEPWWG